MSIRLVCVVIVSIFACLPSLADGATEARAADAYRIGVGDVLRVVVWNEPELTMTVPVRPDGRITVPLINDVNVEGVSPMEVRDRLTERLTEFIRAPKVTVIVEQINSFTVYFLGEVNTQGAIQLVRPTRILQGIALAGGLTEFSKRKITLLREEGGVEKRIDIDYKQLASGAAGQDNLFLSPGDTLLCL